MDSVSALLFTSLAMASTVPTTDAHKAILSAYMKQSGIEDNLSRTAKYLERRELSKETTAYLGYAALVTKVVMDKQIAITWHF